jgi:hypothetical protein
MAITSIGYDGTVDEADWTKLMGEAARSTYGVGGKGDWKVTSHPTLDRGVVIATGSGWGNGVHDTSSTTVSLAGATISSGSRWDMVVARRNWSGTGGSTSFAMITGTSTRGLPSRENTPGTLDDQPIALVQFSAGQASAMSIIDLRVWPGEGGGLYAKDALARNYNTAVGTRMIIDGDDWVSVIDSSGNQTWSRQSSLNSVQLLASRGNLFGGDTGNTTPFFIQSGSQVSSTDGAGYGRITWPTPFPNGLVSVIGMSGDDWALGEPSYVISSGNPAHGTAAGGDKTSWVYTLYVQNSSSKSFTHSINKLHRVNWIAIGF